MPSIKELERWMSTGQVSRYLGRSRQGVLNLAEDRRLRAVRTGAGWIYDPDDVERFKQRESERERGEK